MNTTRHGRQRPPARTAFPDLIRTIDMTDIATRSTKMYLIQEDLARAHIRTLQDEAAAERVASGLVRVRKAVRKANKARLYARRALASAIAYD
jgi:predicted GNAT family N-acyltransferase